jgi:Holliday junction DNA helicase RuvA
MIGRLHGQLAHKAPPQVVVDCHGVGYEVDVPMSTFEALPELGHTVTLLTHFVVREDAQLLYGFATEVERMAFRQLIKTTGVGPKMALSILSCLSVGNLVASIKAEKALPLTKVPGIGKKIADRLILELQGKLDGLVDVTHTRASTPAQHDILQALIALGYSDKEAAATVKTLPAEVGVNEGIKLALRGLNR